MLFVRNWGFMMCNPKSSLDKRKFPESVSFNSDSPNIPDVVSHPLHKWEYGLSTHRSTRISLISVFRVWEVKKVNLRICMSDEHHDEHSVFESSSGVYVSQVVVWVHLQPFVRTNHRLRSWVSKRPKSLKFPFQIAHFNKWRKKHPINVDAGFLFLPKMP